MPDRVTKSLEQLESQTPPQTFYIDYNINTSESALVPVTRGIDGAPAKPSFGFPPVARPSGRDSQGVYITQGAADPKDVHPVILGNGGYQGVVSGVMAVMDGIEVMQPVYDMVAIQNYLTGNAWHYAAVKAKATAATELGYTWMYEKKSAKGIVTPQTKALSDFEDRIYERNHKDLAGILRDQAMDYFSTGNQALEIAYTAGGKVDSLYAVPAITVFRHPVYPVAVQALPDYERWSSVLDLNSSVRNGLEVKAVLPLFMSGLTKADLMRLFPDADSEIMTNNELVHVTNSLISTDPFYGVADILPALSAMLGDNAANEYNWQFFENNAIPRYAVTISGGKVSEAVANSVKDFFNREIQGRAHRTVVLPLPRDMTATFQALDATQNDASFIQFKKLNREEIAAVHSIPPSEIGLWESANKANSSQQARNYFRKVIQPYQVRVEAMMNRILQHGLGLSGVRFKFRNVEYTDDQERATVAYTKTQAFRQYVDGISNLLKTLSDLTGESSGGGSPHNSFSSKNPPNNNTSLSSSARVADAPTKPEDSSGKDKDKGKDKGKDKSKGKEGKDSPTVVTPPPPHKDPLLTPEEVKPLALQLIEQAMEARELFELDHILEMYE